MSGYLNFPTIQLNQTPYTANQSQPPFRPNEQITPLFQAANQAQVQQWTASNPPPLPSTPPPPLPSTLAFSQYPSYSSTPSQFRPNGQITPLFQAANQAQVQQWTASNPPPLPSTPPPPLPPTLAFSQYPSYSSTPSNSNYYYPTTPTPPQSFSQYSSYSSTPPSSNYYYPTTPTPPQSFSHSPSFPQTSSSSSNYCYQVTSASSQSYPPPSSYCPTPSSSYPMLPVSSSSCASNPLAIPTSMAVSCYNQPVSYPLQQALSTTLDPVILLQLLNPDFNIYNEEHRREMYAWLGFPENYQITTRDLEVIQRKIIYADLKPEQQGEARRAFYRSLRPLLTEGQQVELPFKDSDGNTIQIKLVKDPETQQSVIELFFYSSRKVTEHKFSIKENGELIYVISEVYFPGSEYDGQIGYGIIGVNDYKKEIISYRQPYLNHTEEWLKKDYEEHSNACFNLLMQSHEKIHSFLSQNSSEKNKRARHLFQTCISLLNAFATKQHPIQILQNSKGNQLAYRTPAVTTTTTYGPFWNPVTNASDSLFNWKVQEQKSGISFSSKKISNGRAFHSRSERSVILSTTENPSQFKVTIERRESWDTGQSHTNLEYLCELNSKGHPVITPLNKETHYEELALFMGIPDIHVSESSGPTLSDQQKDAQFVSEVLENIAEISSSPHTIVVPSSSIKAPCLTLQGVTVPSDRIAYFAARCVNSYGGIIQNRIDQKTMDKAVSLYKTQFAT